MKKEQTNTDGAKAAFNNIKILRGQFASIATCDRDGNPNVAPIGSMRIVDDGTVHVLQGFLPRTMQNLKSNPKATFSVCIRPSFLDLLTLFGEKEDERLGYQVHCELTGTDASKEAVEREYRQIANRAPRIFRKHFLKFCQKNLKRLLTFRITDVREIGSP
jgi:hypothetical protein